MFVHVCWDLTAQLSTCTIHSNLRYSYFKHREAVSNLVHREQIYSKVHRLQSSRQNQELNQDVSQKNSWPHPHSLEDQHIFRALMYLTLVEVVELFQH